MPRLDDNARNLQAKPASPHSKIKHRVRTGIGRDAADVAFCTILGDLPPRARGVWIDGPDTTTAVATAAMSLRAPA